MKKFVQRRALTGALVVALATATPLTLPGIVAPASAQSLASVIDTSKTATLTVHKYSGLANADLPANGLPLNPGPSNTPLAGVGFKLQRIEGLDVTKISDWQKVQGLNNDATKASTLGTLTDVSTQTTNNAGTASWTNQKLGFYVLTETSAPAGYVTSGPWIIALPMTNQWSTGNDTAAGSTNTTGSQWNYDVNVYPKNEKPDVTKTVVDKDKNIGDSYTYQIDAAIPAGDAIKSFFISDYLDERLTTQDSDVKVELLDANGNATAADSSWFTKTMGTDKRKVVATATPAGLTGLAAALKAGTAKKVRLTIVAKATASGNGDIPNTANVYYNNPNSEGIPKEGPDTPPTDNPPTPTPTVHTYESKVKITKKDNNGATLQGAEFQVYKCTSQDAVATFDSFNSNGKAGVVASGSQPLTVNGKNTWVSGTDGAVTIDALHVQDFVDNKDVDTTKAPLVGANAEGYCLVETKAPQGKELQPTPIFFQLSKADAGQTNGFEMDVTDPDKNAGFELPLTGGNALLIFGALAVLPILAAGYFTLRGRKDES